MTSGAALSEAARKPCYNEAYHNKGNFMLRVLYIDDDETNRDIVKRILARAPYEVEVSEADDGHVGVAMAGEKHPELILMDFHMPGLAVNASPAGLKFLPSVL